MVSTAWAEMGGRRQAEMNLWEIDGWDLKAPPMLFRGVWNLYCRKWRHDRNFILEQ